MCVSDCNTVWVLCFEVELCPETGNSHIVVIKLWLLEYNAFAGSGFCTVPGHVILTCKLHISGKI